MKVSSMTNRKPNPWSSPRASLAPAITLFLAIFSTSTQAAPYEGGAGNGAGNGGSAWVCREKNSTRTIRWARLMDLWEGENDPSIRATYTPAATVEATQEKFFQEVAQRNLLLSFYLRADLKRIQSKILKSEAHVGASLPEDATIIHFPKEHLTCVNGTLAREAVALYREDGFIAIDDEIYRELNIVDQAALPFHEMFYAMTRAEEQARPQLDYRHRKSVIENDHLWGRMTDEERKAAEKEAEKLLSTPVSHQSDRAREILRRVFSDGVTVDHPSWANLEHIYLGPASKNWVSSFVPGQAWTLLLSNLHGMAAQVKVRLTTNPRRCGSFKRQTSELDPSFAQDYLRSLGMEIVDELGKRPTLIFEIQIYKGCGPKRRARAKEPSETTIHVVYSQQSSHSVGSTQKWSEKIDHRSSAEITRALLESVLVE